MKYIIYFLSTCLTGWLLLFTSCSTPDIDQKSPRLLWKTSTTNESLIWDQVDADVQYNGGVLFDGMKDGKTCLYFLNSTDGTVRWAWDDFFKPNEAWATVHFPYQYQNLILILAGNKVFCIDLNNGSTKWKRKIPSNFTSFSSGLGDTYYLPADSYPNGNGTSEGKILTGNLVDGTNESILATPNYTRNFTDHNNSLGEVVSCNPVSIGNDKGVLIFFHDPLPEYDLNIFLGLYNITQKKWEYEKQPFLLNANYGIGPPLIKDNKVYNSSGKIIQCHDLYSGNILWSTTVSDRISSYDGWVDNKILSTTQDRITHCIDPATGKELWALTTSGNPGLISELNGIAYFVGGNAKLFAIDVAAGKILWQFDSPDMKTNSMAFFKQAVRVKAGENGGKGKVMVQSYLNAYCYEAVR